MRIVCVAVLLCAALLGVSQPGFAQGANVDQAASKKVTSYLHTHRLPMVGAQVTNTPSGQQIMLYGFVATDFGKQDAETKAKLALHQPSAAVVNNIRVNPKLQHLKRPPPPDEGDAAGAYDPNAGPRGADWENKVDETLRAGGATPSNDPNLKMPPPGGPAPVPPGANW